jgi:universal stress protein E
MKLIDKILLANDFSKSSDNVVVTGMELGKIFHSEVLPVHVLPDEEMNEKVKALLHETARAKLKETADKLKAEGLTVVDPILTFGSPYSGIVDTADNENASLILTGSGESRQGDKFLLGTTTERIIQRSEKPVFVVKEGVPLNVQHILCPVDHSLTSRRALKNAITMAHRFKADLTVLSVCEIQRSKWFIQEEDRKMENEDRLEEHKKKFDKFLENFNFTGLNWKKEVRKGNPSEEILNTISEKMIDLLVMGTTGKTGLSRWMMGSVTEKVVREVPCSFITLKSEDVITLQLETNIRDIENHYEAGKQLMKDGFFSESIEQFKICLSINNMHVPSHFGIAKVYEKLGETEKANVYRNSGREIMDRMWDQQIEAEARRYRS